MFRRRRKAGGRRRATGGPGRPLRTDPAAVSASDDLPAFLAPPEGAPSYYGFPIIAESEVDGFRLGMITDFVAEPTTSGDAFVVAPDDSRAGLVWDSEVDQAWFEEVIAPTDRRWGVWTVGSPLPLRTIDDTRAFLESILPDLRPRWEAWKQAR